MKYVIEMKNPKTGIVEAYNTEAESLDQLERSLEVFREGGYEVLGYQEIIGEGHSESKLWG